MKRIKNSRLIIILTLLLIAITIIVGFIVWRGAAGYCGDDRECFSRAFQDGCQQKSITITKYTIEGDPIVTTARLSEADGNCTVEVINDSSQDSYGVGSIEEYQCKSLMLTDRNMLWASECANDRFIFF